MSESAITSSVTYFALDLEEREIQRTLTQLANSDVGSAIGEKIEAKGLLGTYKNGVAFMLQGGLQETADDAQDTYTTKLAQPQLHLLFIGSSIGNFSRGEDAQFLRSLPLRAGYGDTLLLGLDHDNGREDIETAYNDPQGHTRNFIMNGLEAAGIALGDSELFDLNNWEYTNSYDEGSRKCIRGTASRSFFTLL